MRAVDLIRRKRDGHELQPDEIAWLVREYTRGSVAPEQMSAFAMAVFFRGMGKAELAALTESMMNSGNTIDLSSIGGVKVDKHSTGGVGDKISICLAPAVAACGVPVPMVSGRGLGHTGGTLDKLQAIPGFRVDVDDRSFVDLVEKHQLALIGQTATLAPADRKLYALRDVTATVESIPLIAASIMSKKLAEGIDALVLDVKVGSGAFMKTLADARKLAETMVAAGQGVGRRVRALLTDMNEVLGQAVGNASEIWEALEVMRGRGPSDVVELTVELGAEMLLLGRAADSPAEGRARIRQVLADGRALEKFRQVVEAQGGDPHALDERKSLPHAAHETEVLAAGDGFVGALDCEAIGRAAMILGAGRARVEDAIDPGVGLDMLVRRGQRVRRGQPLVRIAFNDDRNLAEAERVLQAAIALAEKAPESNPLIYERLGEIG